MVPNRDILISAFPPCDPRDFGSRARCVSAEAGPSFRLGAQHLDSVGLSARWLMGECGHRHTLELADAFALRGLVDARGQRIKPLVVSCRLSGSLGRFGEGDAVVVDMFSRPISRSAWQSTARVERLRDQKSVMVEIVSQFVEMKAPCWRSMIRAEPTESPDGYPAPLESIRADALQAQAKASLAAARACDDKPVAVIPVFPRQDFGQDGLFDFTRYADLFDRADNAALPEGVSALDMVGREMRFFAQPGRSDVIELRAEIAPVSAADLRSTAHARRHSNGEVLATCETTWRPLHP